jgi:hypothetical protein
MAEGRVRGFSIATKCATVEELIEKFRDRVDDESILVNTVEARDLGTECAFAILLADKKVAIAGTCIVRDVYIDANNPFMRPGMRIGIKRLGPESQKVFAKLLAKRIAPRRMTQAMPIVGRASTQSIPPPGPVLVMPRSAKPKMGVPESGQQRATQPMRGLRADSPALEIAREPSRRIPTVQIPPPEELPEALLRAPRATPFHLETIATQEAKLHDKVEPATRAAKLQDKPAPVPRVETRTPGSPIVLPANPFTELTDASLEGFVDCRLFEAKGALADQPMPAPLATKGVVRKILDAGSEPLPLPPPPPPRTVEPVAARPTPLPYAHTKLPDLNIPDANDRPSQPLITRRLRNRLLIAVSIVPLLGAAAVVMVMKLAASPTPTSVVISAATVATVELETAATATVERPPPAPIVPRQPIHAVLVKTYPIAATVTVAGRSFGTTPTYIKIPANTPVMVRMERPGFAPVAYPFTSKRSTDRVFVRLHRRGRR